MSPQTSQTSSAITNTVARKAAESGAEEERRAKPEPRKSDSHGGRFGEEDWYRRMRARQAVS